MNRKPQILKLTPWFDGAKHLPSRPGWYMTKPKSSYGDTRPSMTFSFYHPNAQKWHGRALFWFTDDKWRHPPDFNCVSANNSLWCGLAERPRGNRPVL